ncbi:unnamed protein product [Merluccius merluccius]
MWYVEVEEREEEETEEEEEEETEEEETEEEETEEEEKEVEEEERKRRSPYVQYVGRAAGPAARGPEITAASLAPRPAGLKVAGGNAAISCSAEIHSQNNTPWMAVMYVV